MKILVAVIASTTIALFAAFAHEGHEDHGEATETKTVTVTGEVVDMACYLDHNATGAKHAECAKTCIESGLPVGLKAQAGVTYLLIGEHEPINKKLAPYAAKTITVKGKMVSRDGFKMIENAEIVSGAPAAAVAYTCPMHPEVLANKPGKCPKCGMNLVEKK
ncbi:MAG: hypothetical protein PCFJNLEI_03604 [Verrucomicrobiae bacterium]|nr:hypothetical protein [Verrucomicrobiae bacterium]